MTHNHTHDPAGAESAGFLGMSMMMIALTLVVLAAIVVGLFAWQPWDNDGTTGNEGGVDIDISGGDNDSSGGSEGSGSGDGSDSSGGGSGE